MTAAVETFAPFSLWDRRPPTSTGYSWDSVASQPHSSPCSTTTTSSMDSLALQLEQQGPQQQARAVLARRPRLREQAQVNVDVLGFSELHILACCVPPQAAKALQEQRLNELQGIEPYVIVPKLDDWCWEQLVDLPDRSARSVVFHLVLAMDALGDRAVNANVPELFRDILKQLKETQLKEPGQLGTRSSGGAAAGSPVAPSSPAAAASAPAAAAGTYACAATRAGSPRSLAAAVNSRAAGQQQQAVVYKPPGRRSSSGAAGGSGGRRTRDEWCPEMRAAVQGMVAASNSGGGRRARDEWWPEVRAAILSIVAASNGMYQLADFDDALMSHLREMGEEAAWKKLERIHDKLYGLRRETIRNMSAFLMSA